jgi:flagellar protein FlaG
MKVESISLSNTSIPETIPPSEAVSTERKKAQDQVAVQTSDIKVQQEELLDKIKELTDNGTYSVRFEMDDKVEQLIITLVDAEGNVIRQIPSEELMAVMKSLNDLRGNIVDSVS